MDEASEEKLDQLVAEYYKWVIAEGGTDPSILLRGPLSASMRRKLVDSMNDVNVAVAFAEFVKESVLPREVAQAATDAIRSKGLSPPPLA